MANRSMFVGWDVQKETIDVSIAEDGRAGRCRQHRTCSISPTIADRGTERTGHEREQATTVPA